MGVYVNIDKFLRASILKNICKRLLVLTGTDWLVSIWMAKPGFKRENFDRYTNSGSRA